MMIPSLHLKFVRRLLFVFVFHLANIFTIDLALAEEATQSDSVYSPIALNDGWQVGDISSANLDEQAMRTLTQEISSGNFENIHSVVIAHRDRLVYEYYLTRGIGNKANKRKLGREELHVLNSISKSVTSLVLGMALESEFEKALSRPILEYLPEREYHDARINTITLEHVLTMTAGFMWNEMDVSYQDYTNDDNGLQRSSNPIDYILSRPIRDMPGSSWYYNGGLTMVMAAVIDGMIELPFLEFTKQDLFDPLDIKRFIWAGAWPTNRLVNAAWGLRLSARDLAKIGVLTLNQGRWNNKQIVPKQWIALSTRRLREDLRDWGADGIYGYGYQWWHGQHDQEGHHFNAITALGYGGQRIFILPEQQLVVTVLAANYSGDWLKPEAILKRIVAAIK